MAKKQLSLYIHIPFCHSKCNYCDFYSLCQKGAVPESYIDRLLDEIHSYGEFSCKSIYFGGGTPSLLTAEQVDKILKSVDVLPGCEVTLEANPESVDIKKLIGYKQAGVNRLSIGVQSANDRQLKILGRRHDSAMATKALGAAKQAGFANISGDVMLGLSDYSEKEMKDTVNLLIRGGVCHISAYMLKIEEGTKFFNHPPENLPDDDFMAEIYLKTCEYLESLGFIQYEISNFAKDGMYSRHNMAYWQLKDYLGIGPGGASCIDGKRFAYKKSLKSFMQKQPPVYTGNVDEDDFIMLSLRTFLGLSLDKLKSEWEFLPTAQLFRDIEMWEKSGYVTFLNNTVRLTPKGFLVENYISGEIMTKIKKI